MDAAASLTSTRADAQLFYYIIPGRAGVWCGVSEGWGCAMGKWDWLGLDILEGRAVSFVEFAHVTSFGAG